MARTPKIISKWTSKETGVAYTQFNKSKVAVQTQYTTADEIEQNTEAILELGALALMRYYFPGSWYQVAAGVQGDTYGSLLFSNLLDKLTVSATDFNSRPKMGLRVLVACSIDLTDEEETAEIIPPESGPPADLELALDYYLSTGSTDIKKVSSTGRSMTFSADTLNENLKLIGAAFTKYHKQHRFFNGQIKPSINFLKEFDLISSSIHAILRLAAQNYIDTGIHSGTTFKVDFNGDYSIVNIKAITPEGRYLSLPVGLLPSLGAAALSSRQTNVYLASFKDILIKLRTRGPTQDSYANFINFIKQVSSLGPTKYKINYSGPSRTADAGATAAATATQGTAAATGTATGVDPDGPPNAELGLTPEEKEKQEKVITPKEAAEILEQQMKKVDKAAQEVSKEVGKKLRELQGTEGFQIFTMIINRIGIDSLVKEGLLCMLFGVDFSIPDLYSDIRDMLSAGDGLFSKPKTGALVGFDIPKVDMKWEIFKITGNIQPMIKKALLDAVFGAVRGILEAVTELIREQCEARDTGNFGDIDLASLLQDKPAGGTGLLGDGSGPNGCFSEFGLPPTSGNNFLSQVSQILTPIEACQLLTGSASAAVMSAVQNFIQNYSSATIQNALGSPSEIAAFFLCIGDQLDVNDLCREAAERDIIPNAEEICITGGDILDAVGQHNVNTLLDMLKDGIAVEMPEINLQCPDSENYIPNPFVDRSIPQLMSALIESIAASFYFAADGTKAVLLRSQLGQNATANALLEACLSESGSMPASEARGGAGATPGDIIAMISEGIQEVVSTDLNAASDACGITLGEIFRGTDDLAEVLATFQDVIENFDFSALGDMSAQLGSNASDLAAAQLRLDFPEGYKEDFLEFIPTAIKTELYNGNYLYNFNTAYQSPAFHVEAEGPPFTYTLDDGDDDGDGTPNYDDRDEGGTGEPHENYDMHALQNAADAAQHAAMARTRYTTTFALPAEGYQANANAAQMQEELEAIEEWEFNHGNSNMIGQSRHFEEWLKGNRQGDLWWEEGQQDWWSPEGYSWYQWFKLWAEQRIERDEEQGPDWWMRSTLALPADTRGALPGFGNKQLLGPGYGPEDPQPEVDGYQQGWWDMYRAPERWATATQAEIRADERVWKIYQTLFSPWLRANPDDSILAGEWDYGEVWWIANIPFEYVPRPPGPGGGGPQPIAHIGRSTMFGAPEGIGGRSAGFSAGTGIKFLFRKEYAIQKYESIHFPSFQEVTEDNQNIFVASAPVAFRGEIPFIEGRQGLQTTTATELYAVNQSAHGSVISPDRIAERDANPARGLFADIIHSAFAKNLLEHGNSDLAAAARVTAAGGEYTSGILAEFYNNLEHQYYYAAMAGTMKQMSAYIVKNGAFTLDRVLKILVVPESANDATEQLGDLLDFKKLVREVQDEYVDAICYDGLSQDEVLINSLVYGAIELFLQVHLVEFYLQNVFVLSAFDLDGLYELELVMAYISSSIQNTIATFLQGISASGAQYNLFETNFQDAVVEHVSRKIIRDGGAPIDGEILSSLGMSEGDLGTYEASIRYLLAKRMKESAPAVSKIISQCSLGSVDEVFLKAGIGISKPFLKGLGADWGLSSTSRYLVASPGDRDLGFTEEDAQIIAYGGFRFEKIIRFTPHTSGYYGGSEENPDVHLRVDKELGTIAGGNWVANDTFKIGSAYHTDSPITQNFVSLDKLIRVLDDPAVTDNMTILGNPTLYYRLVYYVPMQTRSEYSANSSGEIIFADSATKNQEIMDTIEAYFLDARDGDDAIVRDTLDTLINDQASFVPFLVGPGGGDASMSHAVAAPASRQNMTIGIPILEVESGVNLPNSMRLDTDSSAPKRYWGAPTTGGLSLIRSLAEKDFLDGDVEIIMNDEVVKALFNKSLSKDVILSTLLFNNFYLTKSHFRGIDTIFKSCKESVAALMMQIQQGRGLQPDAGAAGIAQIQNALANQGQGGGSDDPNVAAYIIKAIIQTPFDILKGLAEIMDPHVVITKMIKDISGMVITQFIEVLESAFGAVPGLAQLDIDVEKLVEVLFCTMNEEIKKNGPMSNAAAEISEMLCQDINPWPTFTTKGIQFTGTIPGMFMAPPGPLGIFYLIYGLLKNEIDRGIDDAFAAPAGETDEFCIDVEAVVEGEEDTGCVPFTAQRDD
jgi:hypothetical protein